jgi:hypothetical protein
MALQPSSPLTWPTHMANGPSQTIDLPHAHLSRVKSVNSQNRNLETRSRCNK